MIRGKVTNNWLKISGGVITAESTKAATRACFLYVFRKLGVINPALVKKKTKMGNSNTKPQAKTMVTTVLM